MPNYRETREEALTEAVKELQTRNGETTAGRNKEISRATLFLILIGVSVLSLAAAGALVYILLTML